MTPAATVPALLRPTWAEINLDAVRANLRQLRSGLPSGTQLLFVVKANAYGHGAVPLSLLAQQERLCDRLGVSCIEEGIELRKAGVTLPILVLGSIYPFSGFDAALEHGLAVTIASAEAARSLSEAAARTGKPAACHVKVDTGMGRIGMRRPSASATVQIIRGLVGITLEGIYTHLSSAESDAAYTRLQLRHFSDTLQACGLSDAHGVLRHAAASYAAVSYPDSVFDMIRPGLACYGLMDGFAPAMTLKSRIVFLKDVRSGASIGYGRTFRAPRQLKLATLPIGYADGYARRFSNTAEVLVRGRRCRVAGAVSMDMIVVDVSSVPGAQVGDEAVLIGAQGEDRITAQDLAQWAGTISYEVATAISARVPRMWL
ncbi:MAG: alanine racemase [Elusimicrobia bacterium]|nr:alanine racemase [Elusimicrobiota bacterium]